MGTGRPLEWVKAHCAFSRGAEKPGQESELSGPPHSKELARNREIEKEKKRKEEKEREREKERKERKDRHRDQSSDGAKVF